MNIVLIGYNPRNIGGIESFSRNFKKNIFKDIKFLTEYDMKGPYDVDDVIGSCHYNVINRSLNRASNFKFTKYKMKKYLDNNHFDFYILNTPKYLDIIPDLNKAILIQHTSVENWWNSKYKFDKNKELLDLAKRIKKIIALSITDKLNMIDFLQIPEEKIEVINLPSSLTLSLKNRVPGKKLMMLTRFQNEIKRIDLAIDAMKELPDFTLNIYGSGKDEIKLKDLAKNSKNIIFHGETNNPQEVLDKNDIFILTSDIEGYPISLIEAISRKMPLVIRNTFPAASEIISKNGILLDKEWDVIKFRDAIHNCYCHYDKYSKNSEELYCRYNITSVKDKWNKMVGNVNV